MKLKISITFLTAMLVLLVSTGGVLAHQVGTESSSTLAADLSTAASLGTAFTYQGYLSDDGSSANGSYDFRFRLFNASIDGAQVGDTLNKNAVSVVDGIFMVTLNFGDVFNGTTLYLDIGVRPAGSSAYTTLSPRKALTAAPYASYALRAPWSGLSGVPSGLNDGDDNTTYQAGAGLTLYEGQFSVNFDSRGTANTVPRSDHNHLGQTWVGSDNPLVISGTFAESGTAALMVSNDAGSRNGVYVDSAGNGVQVDSAGDGVYVNSAGNHGVDIFQSQGNGLHVTYALGDGVRAATVSSDRYAGYFQNAALTGDGAGLYAMASTDGAPDIVLGGLSGVDDNGTISSDPRFSTSDIVLFANDHLQIHLDEVNANESAFAIKNGGNSIVFSVNESGNVRADGTYYCPGPCVIQNGSADFAEMLPSVRDLEPGDVLIISPDGLLALSTEPYQTSVMGVYSTQPGYLGGGEFFDQDGFVPLAVAGVVPVKVSAENGPIQPGDLLTTSATAGHAMRCEGVQACFGRTIGKALDGLETGTGVILILVMLQ